ncbi:hypothetical protein BDK51DRAFT_48038 [Blyttiomyces helicus]|uniref:Uncharacterized protein n=1 Tax=Blyttiomyces helicus TaxID=388810 RepID=A0A4P9W118_9FUNG|nr:hypothetical protein BDK51DRAFT_48038 [Blyttiomyces helicus]|eukprot:RKO84378.1 hypothetical protein BDK51DRAFT_48038 [Blyttiomyces helicus]
MTNLLSQSVFNDLARRSDKLKGVCCIWLPGPGPQSSSRLVAGLVQREGLDRGPRVQSNQRSYITTSSPPPYPLLFLDIQLLLSIPQPLITPHAIQTHISSNGWRSDLSAKTPKTLRPAPPRPAAAATAPPRSRHSACPLPAQRSYSYTSWPGRPIATRDERICFVNGIGAASGAGALAGGMGGLAFKKLGDHPHYHDQAPLYKTNICVASRKPSMACAASRLCALVVGLLLNLSFAHAQQPCMNGNSNGEPIYLNGSYGYGWT